MGSGKPSMSAGPARRQADTACCAPTKAKAKAKTQDERRKTTARRALGELEAGLGAVYQALDIWAVLCEHEHGN
jgi:hypothetical protein